jgi:hypothetical protein
MVHNENDKAWCTLSQVVNLGNFENVRVEVGYSKTIKDGDDPIEVVRAIEEDLEDFLVSKIEQIKGVDKPVKKRKRKSRYDDVDATESDIY